MRLLWICLWAAAAVVACASPHRERPPRAPHTPFGTFRSSLGRRLATEAAALTAEPYEAVRDTYSFTGPVPGLGFVDHEHDVVAYNTTAFLDDYVDFFDSVACAEAVTPTAAPGSALPLMPGEGDVLTSRRGVQLDLIFPAGAAADLFLHRMTRSLHVILGAGWEGAAPPACAALTSGVSTFAMVALHAVAADVGALRYGAAAAATATSSDRTLVTVTLAPAPLLAGFASARWRHHVDEDVHRALRARGEALHTHYPAHARGLGADTFYLFSQGLNWEEGAVVEPLMAVGTTWSGTRGRNTSGTVRLQCEGCHAFFSAAVTVELTFCAWARSQLIIPRFCLFFFCFGGFNLGTVSFGPLGVGCDGRHANEYGVGYHLALGARIDADASFGAGFRVTADLAGALVDVPRTAVVPAWQSVDFNFFLLGLPLRIGVELGLHVSLKASGYLRGMVSTGVLTATSNTSHGFSFDQRVDGGRVSTIKSITTDVTRTPPALSVDFGSAALRAELVPTVALVLYSSVRLQAAFPQRLQADFNYTAPDAVLCDFPQCPLPALRRNESAQMLSVYITWQPRFALLLAAVRLRDLIAVLPLVRRARDLVNMVPFFRQSYDRLVPDDFVLFPAQTLIADRALDSRQLITAACAPAAFTLQGSTGVRRALAAADPQPRLLAQLNDSAVPARAAAVFAPRARALQYACGNYVGGNRSVPGTWIGTQCTIENCAGLFFLGGGSCQSTYTLSCPVGSANTAGARATCSGSAYASFIGCDRAGYSFDNGGSYCALCSDGQLCPGGPEAASSCPAGSNCTGGVATACPCGTYCPSGSAVVRQCPAGFYCPARAVRPIACYSGLLCPAGSCTQPTPSPSPSQRTATPSHTLPGPPSASPSVLSLPSCNRAPVADDASLLNWPVFSQAPEAQRVVAAARQLRAGFRFLITVRGMAPPDNATELALLSATAYGAVCAVLTCGGSGGPPGYAATVDALPRVPGAAAAAVNSTIFNVTWQMQIIVSSGLLAAADVSSMSADDNATFADALEFARAQIASATDSLKALLGDSGSSDGERSSPMLDCATALASSPGVARALGCGAPPPLARRLQGPSRNGRSLGNSSGGGESSPAAVPLSFLPAVRAASVAIGVPAERWPDNVTLAWTLVSTSSDFGNITWVVSAAPASRSVLPSSVAAGGAAAGVLLLAVLLVLLIVSRRRVARAKQLSTTATADPPIGVSSSSSGSGSGGGGGGSGSSSNSSKQAVRSTMAKALAMLPAAAHRTVPAEAPPNVDNFAFSNPLKRGSAAASAGSKQQRQAPRSAQLADGALEAGGSGPEVSAAPVTIALSSAARRQYARVLKAESDLASARSMHIASSALRALRQAEGMDEADAAAMIVRAWRARKLRRVQAHFARVAVFDS